MALQRARGRVGDEPLAARDDRGHAVSGGQVRVSRALRPVLAQPLDSREHDGHLLDRVDGAALLGRELCDARMAGAAVHRDAREQTAAARDPDGELGRLGHDGGVGLQQTGGEQAAGTGRLLVGDRVDDQVARERHAQIGQRAGGDDHARDAALHVARPAAVEQTVALDGRERVGERPGRARLDVDDVDVAVEQEGATAAGSAEARDELRAALEREVVGHHRVRPQRGRRPARAGRPRHRRLRSSAGQVLLQRALLPRRRARRVRHGVERHELARQGDERLAARRHGVDDALLLGRERHRAIP